MFSGFLRRLLKNDQFRLFYKIVSLGGVESIDLTLIGSLNVNTEKGCEVTFDRGFCRFSF